MTAHKKLRHHHKHLNQDIVSRNRARAILFVASFAVIGVILLLAARAASPSVSFEAENAVLAGSATVGTDSSASANSYVVFNTAPGSGSKPTDASTGPRIATTSAPGGTLTGTYTGKHFTSSITAGGALTLKDCTIDGGLEIGSTNGPVVVENCDINGWFGVNTTNTDPDKAIITVRRSKFVGPTDNDSVRLGALPFGDTSKYINGVFEDSIFYSPYDSTKDGSHFDLLQTGGGRNLTFTNVLFKVRDYQWGDVSGPTNYFNNGTKTPNVVMNNVWFEGGPVSYTLSGPMIINTCVIARSSGYFGDIYPSSAGLDQEAKLTNCTDDTGAPITSRR
jgi:hypothetical protein